MMRKAAWRPILVVALAVSMGAAALAGAPDATLVGPMRGALDLCLPYSAGGRAAGLGGATVALEGTDSNNPAALGFVKRTYNLSMGYGRANFRQGPDLNIYSGNLVFPMPILGGTSKLMGYYINTADADRSRMMGLEADVWARQFGLAYGFEVPLRGTIPGRLALGFAGFPSDPSELTLKAPGGGRIAHGRGQSKFGSFRLGTLYKPTERLSLGGEFTHIKDSCYATYHGLGIPGRFKSNYYCNIATVGAAYRVLRHTRIMAQYLFGRAHGQGLDHHYGIFSSGIEHDIPITETYVLSLRAGSHSKHPTFGVGMSLPFRCRVDYALAPSYGVLARKAFGHAPMHLVSFSRDF